MIQNAGSGTAQRRVLHEKIAFLRRLRHHLAVRQPRHDQIAFRRQRYLAVFLLMIDIYVIALSALVAYIAKWHPITQDGFFLTGTLALATVICLLLAAGVVGGLRGMWNEGISAAPGRRHPDPDFFVKRRMVFFYTGVNLNILGLAILVEQTGGITASPYIAVFFAFVLTGQQLSRFKTQSSFLISVGVALTAAMWVYESVFGPSKTPGAPKVLTFLLVASTFVACGLITNYEKGHNYLVEGEQSLPTHAHVYRDSESMWHYAVYCQRHRLDPIFGHDPEEAGTESSLESRHDSEETGTESSLENVRDRVEAIVKSMYQAAGWGQPSFEWRRGDQETDLIVEFPPNEAGKSSAVSRSGRLIC